MGIDAHCQKRDVIFKYMKVFCNYLDLERLVFVSVDNNGSLKNILEKF